MPVQSEARSGRPSTSPNEEVVENVRQIVMKDRRLTLRKIVEEQLIKTTTWRFYVACVMMCEESGQIYGQERTGSFTMTMLPLIPLM